MKLVKNAYAKINLGLDVIRRREDGYHEVKMVMQAIFISFSFVKGCPIISFKASIAAAASVLPPAIPAAIGILFVKIISAPMRLPVSSNKTIAPL